MSLLLKPLVGALRGSGRLGLLNRAPCRGFQSRRGDLVPNHRRIHTAAADPSWQILNRWGITRDTTASVKVVADDKTVAECRTSSGRPFRVSLGAASPPAISFICKVDDDESTDDTNVYVIAAHGDSVLFRRTRVPRPTLQEELCCHRPRYDYFVYKAAAGEPPSLSLLPTCLIPITERDCDGFINYSPTARELDQDDTGVLRRGKDELLVAQLKVADEAPFNTAELCVLRPGQSGEWELKTAVPIVHHRTGKAHDLQMWQDTNVAVPVGDRFLCWVNFDCSTFLLCDMADHDPKKIRYVRLPVKAVPPRDDEDYDDDGYEEQPSWRYFRTIGAAGPDAVRFVSIDNRCCCGAHVIKSSCEHSSSAFMVTMWTLTLTTTGDQPMKWVKESVLDCEDFWSLVACKGLSRDVYLTCPVVSSGNPDVVCFIAREGESLWTVEIDVRRKTLISVSPCPAHPEKCVNYINNLPAKLHHP